MYDKAQMMIESNDAIQLAEHFGITFDTSKNDPRILKLNLPQTGDEVKLLPLINGEYAHPK